MRMKASGFSNPPDSHRNFEVDKRQIISNFRKLINTLTQQTTSTTSDGYRTFKLITREELIRHVESPDTRGKSILKLILAFLYCSISLLTTAFVMVVVHDRVPGGYIFLRH